MAVSLREHDKVARSITSLSKASPAGRVFADNAGAEARRSRSTLSATKPPLSLERTANRAGLAVSLGGTESLASLPAV